MGTYPNRGREAHRRKQLKLNLHIRYPKKITNKSLCRICQEKSLSLQILYARWSFFGHILLRDKGIPANRAKRAFLSLKITNCEDGQRQPCQQRSGTDSTPNQTTLKQRPGRDHRTSTEQEMFFFFFFFWGGGGGGIKIADRGNSR